MLKFVMLININIIKFRSSRVLTKLYSKFLCNTYVEIKDLHTKNIIVSYS